MMSFLKMRVQRGKTAFTDVVASHMRSSAATKWPLSHTTGLACRDEQGGSEGCEEALLSITKAHLNAAFTGCG